MASLINKLLLLIKEAMEGWTKINGDELHKMHQN